MTDLPAHAHRSPSGGLPFAARAGDGYVEALEAELASWTHEFVTASEPGSGWAAALCNAAVLRREALAGLSGLTQRCNVSADDPVHHTPRWVRARLEQGRQG